MTFRFPAAYLWQSLVWDSACKRSQRAGTASTAASIVLGSLLPDKFFRCRSLNVAHRSISHSKRCCDSSDESHPKLQPPPEARLESATPREPSPVGAWIPPNRPLTGDRGQSHLILEAKKLDLIVEEIAQTELHDGETAWIDMERDEPVKQSLSDDLGEPTKHGSFVQPSVLHPIERQPDWGATRRSLRGSDGALSGLAMMTPFEAAQHKKSLIDIPVILRTLLSRKEIFSCVEALGGQETVVILDDPVRRRLGGAIGMIITTVSSDPQRRAVARGLVHQMRLRQLDEVGVLGAQEGPEGSKDPSETWLVVDCRNYIVHIQDAKTRQHINLEGIWKGSDRLHSVNLMDEDDVENYIADNPVPDDYYGASFSSKLDWEDKLKRLKKKRVPNLRQPIRSKTREKRTPKQAASFR